MKDNEKNTTLEQKILKASHLPDVMCGIIILLYTVFILNLNIKTHYLLIVIVFAGIMFAQFCLSPITNHLFMGGVSKKIQKLEAEDSTVEDRTKLLLALHKLPQRKQLEAFFYFFICLFKLI